MMNFNDDVLNAEPTTAESREKLVEELKNRAKGCMSSRNFPEAIKLYAKAIEVSNENNASKAILHANRSMCYLNMNNGTKAIKDANMAIELDPTYVKGYYRQAMAFCNVGDNRSAKSALLKGLELKPDDKELKTQLVKVEEQLARGGSSPTPAKSSSAKTVSTTTVPTTSKPAANSKPTTSGSKKEESDDDEENLKDLNLRGYKKTADGRTTTFFNNELDETTKSLIGNIAPKKLETATPEIAVAAADATSASVWNSAGTYEERIVTPWATDYLKELLLAHRSEYCMGADKYIITIPAVESVSGHAQISMLRGKRKQMCDFNVEIKWKFFHETAATPVIEGKLSILDITADKELEIQNIEVTTLNGSTATWATLLPSYQMLVNMFIKTCNVANNGGFQKRITEMIHAFCDEFKTK